MTIRATLTAAAPEARRISLFLERFWGEDGAVVSLDEESDDRWRVDVYRDGVDAEALLADLRDRLGSDGFGAPATAEILPDANWVAVGLEGLKPVAAGRFVVHGSHDRGAVAPGRVAIEIDAGQAFGSGHHGTTAGCLRVLGSLLRARLYRAALDLGTGSGVLAIALAKTLRGPVLATDLDPIAVRVAAENARLNGVAPWVRAIVADGLAHPALRARAPFDLVVANILAAPLMRLAPAIAAALAPGGDLVLSGLLTHQRERVVAHYRAAGLYLVRSRIVEGWAVLHLRKPDSRRLVRNGKRKDA